MISDQLIADAAADLVAGKLSPAAQTQLLTYIRALDRYKNTPGLFPGLADKLAAATGFTAQFLQAVLNGAKAAGVSVNQLERFTSIKVGTIALGINASAQTGAYAFFNDALNILYDVPAQRPTSAVRPMVSSVSICQIHRLSYSLCGCRQGARLVF